MDTQHAIGAPNGMQLCPNCGTRLFHKVLGQSEVLSVKPGTLNDTTWLKPGGHIWAKSAQAWAVGAMNGLLYDENPENFSDLISA